VGPSRRDATSGAEVSQWKNLGIEEKIIDVLGDVPRDESHHFGRPFMTAYQVAIGVCRLDPSILNAMSMEIGGRDVAQEKSFSWYVAWQLSKRIKSGSLPSVEGRYLSALYQTGLSYEAHDGSEVASSKDDYVSMFRLRD
jgi:hypothetical protein